MTNHTRNASTLAQGVYSTISVLLQRLQLWFESIIVSLAENHDMHPTKRLVSALCVAHCITTPSINVLYKIQDAEKILLPLAGMLALHPDGDVKAEYEQVCSHIPDKHRYYMIVIIILIAGGKCEQAAHYSFIVFV